MTMTVVESPLLRMTQDTPTQYWNDSCAVAELSYAVEHGATGATSNPSIVLEVLKKATAYLAEKGSDSARLDAEFLLAHGLSIRPIDLQGVLAAAGGGAGDPRDAHASTITLNPP